MDDAVSVIASGITLTASATSASATIPNDSAGRIPRYVRLSATQSIYVKLGKTTATAVAGDMMVQPGDAVIVMTSGCDKIACLQAATGGILQVSPLENA